MTNQFPRWIFSAIKQSYWILRCLNGVELEARIVTPICETKTKTCINALSLPPPILMYRLRAKQKLCSSCVSACSIGGMAECTCDVEEDNYCYLCCGNERTRCMPAHEHAILRPNGERWERDSCKRCRQNGAELEGLGCEDTDPARLCIGGKCSNSVCHDKQQGAFCDRK